MSPRSSNRFIRGVLARWLERLDRQERQLPRSEKLRWFQIEYHVPPIVVAVISSLLLYAILVWNANFNIYEYVAVGFFVILFVVLLGLYINADHPDLAKSDDAVSLLSVLFFTNLFWILIIGSLSKKFLWFLPYATPVGIAPLLASLLLHRRLAVILAFIGSIFLGVFNALSLEVALVGAVGSLVMVATGARARTAHHIARAGLIVGFTQMSIIFFLAILKGWDHYHAWTGMSCGFASGLLAAFFSLGALPFLESFFSRTSNIRLLELADVNHPLLRKMSLEAPGTYHHSMIVANLAADAAEAIGAHSLLCRVGAYFHDIGKIVKANYFIENQGAFGNPHDQVNPSLSKIIITSHVKDGIALGKKYNLDQQVLDFIPQHHGTSQIEFFYQKALKLEEHEDELVKEDVKEETYRYPGPKPQTREAAIVMMADSVEAASRTLEEPNHERYKDLVYKIVNKKLFDNQLNETTLTLKDLHIISQRFVATLTSINHARVPYPEADKTGPKKEKKDRLSPPQ